MTGKAKGHEKKMTRNIIEEVIEQFQEKKGDNLYLAVSTRSGEVQIHSMQLKHEGHLYYLDIMLGSGSQGGDPHFRIFNPPQYVYDPEGDIEENGRRYRRDPFLAVVETVASQGGSR